MEEGAVGSIQTLVEQSLGVSFFIFNGDAQLSAQSTMLVKLSACLANGGIWRPGLDQ